jgi:hypothetical protein
MVSDAQLAAAVAQDPFHTVEAHAHGFDTFAAVSALLAQVFTSADQEPSGIWALSTEVRS